VIVSNKIPAVLHVSVDPFVDLPAIIEKSERVGNVRYKLYKTRLILHSETFCDDINVPLQHCHWHRKWWVAVLADKRTCKSSREALLSGWKSQKRQTWWPSSVMVRMGMVDGNVE
jgi:hypothetical protein